MFFRKCFDSRARAEEKYQTALDCVDETRENLQMQLDEVSRKLQSATNFGDDKSARRHRKTMDEITKQIKRLQSTVDEETRAHTNGKMVSSLATLQTASTAVTRASGQPSVLTQVHRVGAGRQRTRDANSAVNDAFGAFDSDSCSDEDDIANRTAGLSIGLSRGERELLDAALSSAPSSELPSSELPSSELPSREVQHESDPSAVTEASASQRSDNLTRLA